MNVHWSTSFLVAVSLISVGTLVSLGGLIFCIIKVTRFQKKGPFDDRDGWVILLVICGVGVLSFVAGGLAGLYPYSSEYHQYRTISGVVDKTNSRFLGDGNGGTNQKFVIQYRGNTTAFYGCNDTRCSLAKRGDRLSMDCERTHQFSAGVDGWDCLFRSLDGTR